MLMSLNIFTVIMILKIGVVKPGHSELLHKVVNAYVHNLGEGANIKLIIIMI